jgi:hypothetical protein
VSRGSATTLAGGWAAVALSRAIAERDNRHGGGSSRNGHNHTDGAGNRTDMATGAAWAGEPSSSSTSLTVEAAAAGADAAASTIATTKLSVFERGQRASAAARRAQRMAGEQAAAAPDSFPLLVHPPITLRRSVTSGMFVCGAQAVAVCHR